MCTHVQFKEHATHGEWQKFFRVSIKLLYFQHFPHVVSTYSKEHPVCSFYCIFAKIRDLLTIKVSSYVQICEKELTWPSSYPAPKKRWWEKLFHWFGPCHQGQDLARRCWWMESKVTQRYKKNILFQLGKRWKCIIKVF